MTITAAALSTNRETRSTPQERKERFQTLFQHYPAVVRTMIESLDATTIHEDWIRDVSIPETWSCGPVVILGDAAHAMTPHMGQGANMGLEDVCELVHCLVPVLKPNGNTTTATTCCANATIRAALTSFWQARHARVTAVHEQSRQNSIQSNTFDKETASIPFERRNYTQTFKEELYNWQPPPMSLFSDDEE